jgi:hypothetical protein
MALTEKVRLLLEAKGFGTLYTEHEDVWRSLANDARDLIRPQIANGDPTVDDIKQVLLPLMELQRHFRSYMEEHPKLTQRYWPSYFTDYALHRVYNPHLNIEGDEQDG